eukprot:1192-Chlamydomonas_euryale.AAC.2
MGGRAQATAMGGPKRQQWVAPSDSNGWAQATAMAGPKRQPWVGPSDRSDRSGCRGQGGRSDAVGDYMMLWERQL